MIACARKTSGVVLVQEIRVLFYPINPKSQSRKLIIALLIVICCCLLLQCLYLIGLFLGYSLV